MTNTFTEKYMYENEFIERYGNETLDNIDVINKGTKNSSGSIEYEFIVKDKKIKLYGLGVKNNKTGKDYFIIRRKEYKTEKQSKLSLRDRLL